MLSPQDTEQKSESPYKWQPLVYGHIKINVHTVMNKFQTGIGVVARDNNKNILAALTQNLPKCSFVQVMDAQAVI